MLPGAGQHSANGAYWSWSQPPRTHLTIASGHLQSGNIESDLVAPACNPAAQETRAGG